MTSNGNRPGPADVAAAFAEAGEYETRRPETPAVAAEYAVAGSAIQTSALAAETLAALRPEHFGDGSCRVVIEAVETLDRAGQPVEPPTVMAESPAPGRLTRIHGDDMGTGGAFLHSLVQRAGDIGYHAPLIVGEALRRSMTAAIESMRADRPAASWDPAVHPDEIRKRIDAASAGLAAGRRCARSPRPPTRCSARSSATRTRACLPGSPTWTGPSAACVPAS